MQNWQKQLARSKKKTKKKKKKKKEKWGAPLLADFARSGISDRLNPTPAPRALCGENYFISSTATPFTGTSSRIVPLER